MAITERYVTTTGTDTYANSTNIATPMSWATMLTNAAAGDRINVKAGTYTMTINVSDTLTNAGTVTSPIILRGYSGSIGDGYLGRTNNNGALITTNMPALVYSGTGGLTTLAFTILESLNITTAKNGVGVTAAADNLTKSCLVVNSSTGASATALAVGTRGIALDNDCSLTGASGGSNAISSAAANARILGNRVKGGPATGISSTGGGFGQAIIGNVVFASAGNGIAVTNVTAVPCIYGNTVVGSTGDGINIVTANTVLQCVINNMITDQTGNGINLVSTSNGAFLGYNRTRDNSSAVANGGDWATATTYAHVTTDTGGPETDYVDSASNDYRLIGASPAKGTAIPFSADIGGTQRAEPTSGGAFTFGG